MKGTKWLWLALPLTLLVGCASAPRAPGVVYSELQAAPEAPAAPALTARQTADRAIAFELFRMFVADKGINYPLWATVRNGDVTLGATSGDARERQRLVDRTWELGGVSQVTDSERGNMDPTVPAKAVAAR